MDIYMRNRIIAVLTVLSDMDYFFFSFLFYCQSVHRDSSVKSLKLLQNFAEMY